MRYHEYILINIKNRNRKKVANKLMVKSILKNSMKDEGYEGDDDEKALVWFVFVFTMIELISPDCSLSVDMLFLHAP